jgi:hypothetical protein
MTAAPAVAAVAAGWRQAASFGQLCPLAAVAVLAFVAGLHSHGGAQPLSLRAPAGCRPAASAGAALGAAPGGEGGIGLGTLASPCTGWSEYTLQRLAESPHAECLAEGRCRSAS